MERKLSWIASAHELLGKIIAGPEVVDFFDEVTISVLRASDPIEALCEQFHNELNQRLERLRMVRRTIENSTETAPAQAKAPAGTAPAGDVSALSGSDVREAISPISEQAGGSSDEITVQLAENAAPKRSPAQPVVQVPKTKVMLVLCSRNGTARQALCRFATQMNLHFEIVDYNPEQPAMLAEQIYHHRDSKFAVVYWGEPAGRELPGTHTRNAMPDSRWASHWADLAAGAFHHGIDHDAPLPGFTPHPRLTARFGRRLADPVGSPDESRRGRHRPESAHLTYGLSHLMVGVL